MAFGLKTCFGIWWTLVWNKSWWDKCCFDVGLRQISWLKSSAYATGDDQLTRSYLSAKWSQFPRKMKVFEFIFVIFIHLGFLSARPSRRNRQVTTISIPTTKAAATTPSTTIPRPIPRPIGKMVFFLFQMKYPYNMGHI